MIRCVLSKRKPLGRRIDSVAWAGFGFSASHHGFRFVSDCNSTLLLLAHYREPINASSLDPDCSEPVGLVARRAGSSSSYFRSSVLVHAREPLQPDGRLRLLRSRWPRPLLMLYNATGAKPVLMRRKRLLKGSPTAEPQQQTMLLIVLLSS